MGRSLLPAAEKPEFVTVIASDDEVETSQPQQISEGKHFGILLKLMEETFGKHHVIVH